MVWALIMNRHPGQLHNSIFASTSLHWNVSALQPPLCSLNFLLFFFLNHKILESIYAWNRHENLVGVRLSFSSGVAPPYPHGLWYNRLLTVVLKANTLNFMGKCRIQPTPCFCFCHVPCFRRALSVTLSLMSNSGQTCGHTGWLTDWGRGVPHKWKLESLFFWVHECLLHSPDSSFISKY